MNILKKVVVIGFGALSLVFVGCSYGPGLLSSVEVNPEMRSNMGLLSVFIYLALDLLANVVLVRLPKMAK